MAMICAKHGHDMCNTCPWYEQHMVMICAKHAYSCFGFVCVCALEANLIQSSNEYGETTTLFVVGEATVAVGGSKSEKSITKQYFCERIKQ